MTSRQRKQPLRPDDDGRVARTLARPLIDAGIERAPGETVRLRPDQIARLEPEGYFEKEVPQ